VEDPMLEPKTVAARIQRFPGEFPSIPTKAGGRSTHGVGPQVI